jgi:hypothetical protein
MQGVPSVEGVKAKEDVNDARHGTMVSAHPCVSPTCAHGSMRAHA